MSFFFLIVSTAQSADSAPKEMTGKEFEASLKFQRGEIVLPGGIATLKVPDSFQYLNPEDTERVLVDAWGNPKGDRTLGMITPSDVSLLADNGWAVIITYQEDGYVSDKDADSINYDTLLEHMKEGIADENKERQKQGYQTIQLIGWAAEPHYDKNSHKLYWAKEIAFGDDKEHTLNYNIRILGRRGVLVLNAVSGMQQLSSIEQQMPVIISCTDFNPGYRYSDYKVGMDKTAEYGIAALVAGGIAAKTGLFTKLLGLLLAAKKILIAALIALGAFLTKILKSRKNQDRAITPGNNLIDKE